MNTESNQHSSADILRGNVEAGLRLLLKSEKPLYRRAAEVGMEDLQRLCDQLDDAREALHLCRSHYYAKVIALQKQLRSKEAVTKSAHLPITEERPRDAGTSGATT